ncbi:MAG TPA: pentapeptide repeat-containing protein [Chroococcales cyanobacterium]
MALVEIAGMDVTEILKNYAAGLRDFGAAELAEMNLSGANLSSANLSEANLSVANLSGANLNRTNLSRAKLNVARLSGANLSEANLAQANLNVANLIRADLRKANLFQSALIRAELIRADLSEANLSEANLSGADLREAALRQANLRRATLSDTNLRGAFLTSANLETANLNSADLSRGNLSGSNLRGAELRHANLTLANLSGVNLSGANLRWADLSGANLRWADLTGAKLSGANLVGADLSNAHLIDASLVYADLTQACLIKANWIGADLTGATLTGAKLYAVSRFGLKTDGITCEWLDLSPEGDKSKIVHLSSTENSKKFFSNTLPTVRIVVDAPLDLDANLALASTYHQMAQLYPALKKAPSLKVGVRRTLLTFHIESNAELFTIAYLAIFPFSDAVATHRNITALVNLLRSPELGTMEIEDREQIERCTTALQNAIAQLEAINPLQVNSELLASNSFFQAPTNTMVTNSSDRSLSVYYHPAFGQPILNQPSLLSHFQTDSMQTPETALPSLETIVEFIKAFD